MGRSLTRARHLLIGGMALSLVACNGGGATSSPASSAAPPSAATEAPSAPPATDAPTASAAETDAPASPTESATEAPSAEPPTGDNATITIGLGSLGVSTMMAMAAGDRMEALGYTVETTVLTSVELSVEGVSNGLFDLGTSGNSNALIAMQAGGALRFIVDNIANEWSLYSQADHPTCADLDGEPVGIFSIGGVSTAMVVDYLAQDECQGAEPNYLTLGDSQARAQALLANQITATPVELSDALTLDRLGGDQLVRMTSFAESLPDLKTTSFYANTTFLEENPDGARAFTKALLEVYREIAGNPERLRELVMEFYPEVDQETLVEATTEYANGGYFDVNGGLTEENVQATIDFFASAEVIQPGMTVADAADLSVLEDVLAEIGQQ